MILSMTGFGKGSTNNATVKFTALIKAVNGRFLDIKLRGLELSPEDEKKIRDIITQRLVRGTIYVNLDRPQENGARDLSFNSEKFEVLENVLLMIQKKYGRHLEMSSLINAGDLLTTRESKENYSKEIIDAVEAACSDIEIMRGNEGRIMQDDLEIRLSLLEKILEKIMADLPEEFINRKERFKNRIEELLESTEIEEARLLQEAAIMAEKSDVTEEAVRLKSHFKQFRMILREKTSAGRKLNFLLQEISREINTIGSKSYSNKIITLVIDMKDEAEKMREQIQNVL